MLQVVDKVHSKHNLNTQQLDMHYYSVFAVVGELVGLGVGLAVGQVATAHQGPVGPVGLFILEQSEPSNSKPVAS